MMKRSLSNLLSIFPVVNHQKTNMIPPQISIKKEIIILFRSVIGEIDPNSLGLDSGIIGQTLTNKMTNKFKLITISFKDITQLISNSTKTHKTIFNNRCSTACSKWWPRIHSYSKWWRWWIKWAKFKTCSLGHNPSKLSNSKIWRACSIKWIKLHLKIEIRIWHKWMFKFNKIKSCQNQAWMIRREKSFLRRWKTRNQSPRSISPLSLHHIR